MNYLKYTYDRLQEFGYFENNINIILTHAPRQHKRLIENFLCCADNPKFFISSYLKLREELKKDRTLVKSIVLSYKDLVCENLCNPSRNAIEFGALKYITILLLDLFIDDKGSLRIGNTRSNCVVLKAIKVLTNEKYSIGKTIKEIRRILNIELNELSDNNSVSNITHQLFPYVINLLEPAVYKNTFSDDMYLLSLRRLEQSAKDTCANSLVAMKFKLSGNVLQGATSLLLFSNISVREMDLVEEIVKMLKLTTYNRTGFLKPEYAVGTMNAKYSKLFNTNQDLGVDYYINEIIHKDGILIKFQITTKDFLITVIDDYISNTQIMNIMFYDSSRDNTSENMQTTAFLYYYAVREVYAEKINEEKYTIPMGYLDEEDGTEESDDKYTKKLIQIAPYVRFLPKGAKRGEGKVEEAAKFNMVLTDDETFVNSFDKHCRVLKGTPDERLEDIRFETRY